MIELRLRILSVQSKKNHERSEEACFQGDFFFLSFYLSSFSSVAMASVVWLFSFWFACYSLSVMANRTYIVQMNHHQKPLSFATHDDWYSASL